MSAVTSLSSTPAPVLARASQLLTVAAPSTVLAGLPAGARLDALVLHGGGPQATVLHTQHGAVTVQGGSLPAGASVTLQVQEAGDKAQLLVVALRAVAPSVAMRSDAAASAVHQGALAAAASTESALASLMKQIPAANPASASPAGSPVALPADPGGRGAEALFFLFGLRRGAAAWLGADLAAKLERTGGLDGVERGLVALREQAARAEFEGWRLFPLPWAVPGETRTARLWIRSDGTVEMEEAVRLVLELDTPERGRLRFEGFLSGVRFDLVLRAEFALPDALARDLAGIFARAAAGAGFHGRFTALTAGLAFPAIGPEPAAGVLA